MKYTKNIHNKLLLNGFKFQCEHEETEEEYLNYTVYEKGFLEVSVSDPHKEVNIYLKADDEELSFLSYEQLMKLDKIINKPWLSKSF